MSNRFGDVLLVSLVFTDGSGNKKRPALVIYDNGGMDLLIAPITSHQPRSAREYR